MDWYKIYHGLPTDPRLPVIARRAGLTRAETLALWITLHDYASRQKPRGSLYGLDAEETALLLEMDAAKTEAALDAFYDKGMIDIENSISNWAKLQYKSTERVRAYRARKQDKTIPPQKENAAPTPPAQKPAPAAPEIDPDSTREIAARRARLQQQALRAKRPQPPHDD